jgi:hypothetical protein
MVNSQVLLAAIEHCNPKLSGRLLSPGKRKDLAKYGSHHSLIRSRWVAVPSRLARHSMTPGLQKEHPKLAVGRRGW